MVGCRTSFDNESSCQDSVLEGEVEMLSDNIRTSPSPCLSSQVSPSAPTLTSSPGMRISGSRLTLAATYRLMASLPSLDQQLILLMTAMLGSRGYLGDQEPAGESTGAPTDFELAARSCLSGLYVRLVLGRPALVAVSNPRESSGDADEAPSAVKLKLEHVRAVSSTKAEYYFRPTLFALKTEPPAQDDLHSERAFCLARLDTEEADPVSLWAVRKGMETQAGLIVEDFLPVGRVNLVDAIQKKVEGRYGRLASDMLGLDEWRFQEGLRIAFTLVAPRRQVEDEPLQATVE